MSDRRVNTPESRAAARSQPATLGDLAEVREEIEEALAILRAQAADHVERLTGHARARLYRAELVDALPANAPAGKLLVTAGDIHLYVGTGLLTPLRKIPTQPL